MSEGHPHSPGKGLRPLHTLSIQITTLSLVITEGRPFHRACHSHFSKEKGRNICVRDTLTLLAKGFALCTPFLSGSFL